MQERIPGRHSVQLLDMILVHETGDISWFMSSAALAYGACPAGQGSWAICSAVWSARLPGGVCWRIQWSQAGAPGIQTKIFSWPLSIKQVGYLYQFCKFERKGTNKPAILSFIPVLGQKYKSILVSHLTSASKKHHGRQIPLLLPCQDKLAKKAQLVWMHTTAFAAVCSVPPAHSYHHDMYKNTYKHTVLLNLHVIRHLYC